MNTLSTIVESNFNNYERFGWKAKPTRAHDFNSDDSHQYLREVEEREKSPEYDLMGSDESIIRMSMAKTKGEKRFYKYREKIRTKYDRADPDWFTSLLYNTEQKWRVRNTGLFEQSPGRK